MLTEKPTKSLRVFGIGEAAIIGDRQAALEVDLPRPLSHFRQP
jgi:hypothetical protein